MQVLLTSVFTFLGALLYKPVEKLTVSAYNFLSNKSEYIFFFVASSFALVAALNAFIDAAIGSISLHMPDILSDGVAAIFPTNADECISAVYSARFAVFVYRYKQQTLDRITEIQ